MALSKHSVPGLGTSQHRLRCTNPWHQQLRDQCRDEHQKSKECEFHTNKDIEMLCEDCQIPLCSKCASQTDHRGQTFINLETIDAVDSTSKQKKQVKDRESGVKLTMPLFPSVSNVRDICVGLAKISYISLDRSGNIWASNNHGNLVLTDLQGKPLDMIQTSIGYWGYHTVTKGGELIFTDYINKTINKITRNNKIKKFSKTGNWKPMSIHSSHINGDILVGMRKDWEGKVTRYSETGKELQNIQFAIGGYLFRHPFYITENINGDICVSDSIELASVVVVVNKSGEHRFSYNCQESRFQRFQRRFIPFGICTDALGHILVCDNTYVHLLDLDGQLLSLLLLSEGADTPVCVCVDEEYNLYVGKHRAFTVSVYKYIQ